MVRLVILGGGRMGEALLAGLLEAGWAKADQIAVAEPIESRRNDLATMFPGVIIVPAAVPAEGAVIAVKPADVAEACRELAVLAVPRVLCIAAGVTLAQLEAGIGGAAVVRAMPNTPAVVGAAASAVAAGTSATDADLHWAEGILGSVGTVVRVSENLLDAVTGLSGSGPGYVFLVAESMIDAGVLVGLPREVSQALALQTLLGAARLLSESGDAPAELRAAVTSPGGTTAAGLRQLEEAGVRAAFLRAVEAATERSRQLGAH